MPHHPGGIFKPNVVDTAAGREQSPQLGKGVTRLKDIENYLNRGGGYGHDACADRGVLSLG